LSTSLSNRIKKHISKHQLSSSKEINYSHTMVARSRVTPLDYCCLLCCHALDCGSHDCCADCTYNPDCPSGSSGGGDYIDEYDDDYNPFTVAAPTNSSSHSQPPSLKCDDGRNNGAGNGVGKGPNGDSSRNNSGNSSRKSSISTSSRSGGLGNLFTFWKTSPKTAGKGVTPDTPPESKNKMDQMPVDDRGDLKARADVEKVNFPVDCQEKSKHTG
jgi:hypothetical protein